MDSLTTLTPDVEVYSVDEAFLDLTGCQHFYKSAMQIGHKLKALIKHASGGLSCSVGISGDKTTAKFAAKQQKPDGLVVIHPDEAEAALAEYPLSVLSGVNKGIAGFLAQYNVVYCKDMKHLPISILAKRYGNVGRRVWLMAQGKDPEPLLLNVAAPKTIGHGKNLPPETREQQVILVYFQHMAEKVAARLRLHSYYASNYVIALKTKQGWFKWSCHSLSATNDGSVIYQLCKQCVDEFWGGQGVWQIRVVALNPQQHIQTDLFTDDQQVKQDRTKLNATVDSINTRYGEFSVAPASLLNRSQMPNVIAPAWKPHGHRKTV
jgi:DNA polymerase-4